jgi:hypothetical protein
VVASEFAFLVLGLILGIPTGVALLVVLGARSPAPRQVRVTVAPDSVPRRRSATLAGDPFVERQAAPARGGPADTGTMPGPVPLGRAGPMREVGQASTGSGRSSLEPAGAEIRAQARTPVLFLAGHAAAERSPAGRLETGEDGVDRESVGVAVGPGVGALFASFQRAAHGPIASASSARSSGSADSAISGIALLDAAVEARAAERPKAWSAARGEADDGRPAPASPGHPAPPGASVPAGSSGSADSSVSAGSSAPSPDLEPIAATVTGPCGAERRTMTELCALAERMRNQAEGAADRLRLAQRTYDMHVSAADQAEAIADPRVQRAAKDAAQHAFRRDRGRAGSRDEVETAARTWLQDLNRINGEARAAAARLTQERRAATAQVTAIERLTVEADAVRGQAEAALEACLQAREALAACEEALVAAPAGRMPLAPSLAPGEVPPHASPPVEPQLSPAALMARALRSQPSADAAEADELAEAIARGEGQPSILRLLAGDRAAFEWVVAAVAGDDPADQRRWQMHLAGLIDALVARAIDACAFDFPEEHPFWGPFNRGQCRDIALALSSLGFRFDGLGGFADERVPSQRDLSLAVSYAGLDPMRIRRWPSEAEMAELFRDVAVAADEYIAGEAAGLTLGELVTLLGHRADGLTEVWNAWGRIRPRLLEPV